MEDKKEQNYNLLKKKAFDLGAHLFGVANTEPLKQRFLEIEGTYMDDLPYAISLGFPLSKRILKGIVDHPTKLYFFHYQRMNILIDTVTIKLTNIIQDMGYEALPIPSSQVIDWKEQKAHISHKHVAKEAGLGWIGRNNLLVTKRYGSCLRLGTILTDIPLKADSPLDQDCGLCRRCLNVCPVNAIHESPADFDHIACYEQLKIFQKKHNIRHMICGICVKVCLGELGKNDKLSQKV